MNEHGTRFSHLTIAEIEVLMNSTIQFANRTGPSEGDGEFIRACVQEIARRKKEIKPMEIPE